jgi:hypothetical protein
VQPFALRWYNDAVAAEHRLPGDAAALGLLIGNTRALWAPFLAAWQGDAALQADPHPLDRYSETRLTALLRELSIDGALRFAHEPAPRRPAIQRLADVSGLAPLSPVGLNIHPVFGPWIGLRAVLILDRAGPAGPPPRLANPCPDCTRTCVPAFERARAAVGAAADTWRLWYGEAQIRYHYTKERSVLVQSSSRG